MNNATNNPKSLEISLPRAAAQALIFTATLPLIMGTLRFCGQDDEPPAPPPERDSGDAPDDGGASDGAPPMDAGFDAGSQDARAVDADSGLQVERKVYFIAPLDGAELHGPGVRLQLGVSGVELRRWTGVAVPGAGNFVVYIDRPCALPGVLTPIFDEYTVHLRDAQDETIINLGAGTHQLCLGLENGAGYAFDLNASVRFSVVD